ncbi:hypothetical protein SAMN04488245_102319 [Alloyangia pacifica]|uniref:Uncharacterized protein n=2 Tax=Alloyangia pacifica TaxID=311180 RepID=A0A1I6PLL2_9RHOB|nr:hypothetical protein SAMN04488245_102319 [Alloyangia pacifica]SFS40955.1 hypothetical protein SAMN04488050_101620 [Alloyangia pacifica]
MGRAAVFPEHAMALHPFPTLAALFMAALIPTALAAQGPLIDESFLTDRSYVVLVPPAEAASAWVCIGMDAQGNGALRQPDAAALQEALTQDWTATARCDAGMAQIRITGPGGTAAQDFAVGRHYVDGVARLLSFDVSAAIGQCQNWFESLPEACRNAPEAEGCSAALDQSFSFGPGAPLPGSAPLGISASCVNGDIAPRRITPQLELRCLHETICLAAF